MAKGSFTSPISPSDPMISIIKSESLLSCWTAWNPIVSKGYNQTTFSGAWQPLKADVLSCHSFSLFLASVWAYHSLFISHPTTMWVYWNLFYSGSFVQCSMASARCSISKSLAKIQLKKLHTKRFKSRDWFGWFELCFLIQVFAIIRQMMSSIAVIQQCLH